MHNTIKFSGDVSIENCDNIQKQCHNHLINNGFRTLFDILCLNYINMPFVFSGSTVYYYHFPANSWYIHLGIDTTTVTTPTMTELTSLIVVEPSSKQIIVTDGTDDGHYIITYRCIWDAGTISGTIGEMGLYMRAGEHTSEWNAVNTYTPQVKMIARLANADGDFESIVINEEQPFIVDWNIHFKI